MKENRLAVIYEEIDRGRIEERPLVEHEPKRKAIRGYCGVKGGITVNPIPDILDTLIHELFHRRYPNWSERYVKRATTMLIRALSPEEQQALFDHYNLVKVESRRKKAVR